MHTLAADAASEIVSKHARMAHRWFAIEFIRRAILRDPLHRAYTDQSLCEVSDDESESLELLTQNEAARREVDRSRRIGVPRWQPALKLRSARSLRLFQ